MVLFWGGVLVLTPAWLPRARRGLAWVGVGARDRAAVLGAVWQGLEDLQLYLNELSGPLPAEWVAMGKLRRLYLF